MSGVLRQSQGQHWQCNLTTNRERISSLVSSGHLSDVTLVFSDNRRIQAHKLILAMSSPVFEAMMYGAMATNEITLACDSYEMFQLLLCYIYEEEINLSDVFVGIQMYHLAHRYQMDTLALYCSKRISSVLSAYFKSPVRPLPHDLPLSAVLDGGGDAGDITSRVRHGALAGGLPAAASLYRGVGDGGGQRSGVSRDHLYAKVVPVAALN
nr:BTB/POZ domain-containing protein 3-like isoform X1 [Cherax quadricarinatus]